jgi:hypothetical protein
MPWPAPEADAMHVHPRHRLADRDAVRALRVLRAAPCEGARRMAASVQQAIEADAGPDAGLEGRAGA